MMQLQTTKTQSVMLNRIALALSYRTGFLRPTIEPYLVSVQLTQIRNFVVPPHVWLTFSWGNIGVPRINDSANERYCVCHQPPGVRNIGLGGAPASNRAPKRRANVIFIYPESTLSGDQVMTIPRS